MAGFTLGPISSRGGNDVQVLYVDLSRRLPGSETVTTAHGVTCDSTDLAISGVAIVAVAVSDTLGRTVSANKGIQFSVTPGDGVSGDYQIYVEYTDSRGARQTVTGTVSVLEAVT